MNMALRKNLNLTLRTSQFFQSLRGLRDWDEKDGEATAEIMLVKTKGEKHHGKGETRVEARLGAMMMNHKG